MGILCGLFAGVRRTAVRVDWPLDLPPSFVRSTKHRTRMIGAVYSVAYMGSSSTEEGDVG